jgi:hypothetical protein
MEFILQLLAATIVFWATLITPNEADAAQVTTYLLYGSGYATGDESRSTARFDATEAGKYGMFYGRADISSFNDGSTRVNTRMLGHLGKGTHLAAQLQSSNNISNAVLGIGFSALTKDYKWGVDLGRLSSNYYGDGLHLFTFTAFPLTEYLYFDGWAEVYKLEVGNDALLAQPSIMYKCSNLLVGIEYQVAYNKNGTGLDESVPQLKIKMEF